MLPDEVEGDGPIPRQRGRLTMWTATVLTLFPDMFPGPLGASLAGKALASGLWQLEARDIRDAATDRHRSVDDTPAGGGAGMVLRADVLARAFDAVPATEGRPRLLMSPRGAPLTQARVTELASGPGPDHRLRPLRGRGPARHRRARISRKSRSATMCCPAARSRRWS